MEKMELQHLADTFNLLYKKACVTSEPVDWGQAALAGRQLVCYMEEQNMIIDKFNSLGE